ncbi:MAG: hypothetical protein JWO67_1309 [Streptosporangiaceae bacterium]|nr:hypothetical protein [Streptosporangiaceae bacterium]
MLLDKWCREFLDQHAAVPVDQPDHSSAADESCETWVYSRERTWGSSGLLGHRGLPIELARRPRVPAMRSAAASISSVIRDQAVRRLS